MKAWYTCMAQLHPHSLFIGVLEKERMGVERDPFSAVRFKSRSSAMKTVFTWWRTAKRWKHSNVWLNTRVLSGGSDQVNTNSFPRSSQRLPALRSDCFSAESYGSPPPAPAKTGSSQSTRDWGLFSPKDAHERPSSLFQPCARCADSRVEGTNVGCVGNSGSGVMGAEMPGTRRSYRQQEEAGFTLAQLHVLRSQEELFF